MAVTEISFQDMLDSPEWEMFKEHVEGYFNDAMNDMPVSTDQAVMNHLRAQAFHRIIHYAPLEILANLKEEREIQLEKEKANG